MGDGLTRNFLIGDFLLHTDQRRVLRGGEAQPLGARAFDLLLCLIEHRDRVVSKDELLALVWPGVVVEENNLTVQVSALRKVLGAAAVTTVPGRGYRFTLALSDAEPAAAAHDAALHAEPARRAATPNNLPLNPPALFGRQAELGTVTGLLAQSHLLTLVGAGGVGKTRFALEVAGIVRDNYADGVWFVELAPVTDPALVLPTVAHVLNIHQEPGRALLDTVLDFLRQRQMLIVLDNCEHVIEACARWAEKVLHTTAAVRTLATSREALGIDGETVWRMPSLRTAEPDAKPSPEQLMAYPATQLFVERATGASPEFRLTPHNAAAVAQICHQLDGIPLALELAAARVKAMRVEQVAERLRDRFALLTRGSRTALQRHQTLRSLIDWSHELLSEPERFLLRRLSVFAGGWTLEAAEAVCSEKGIAETELLDLLTQLVDKSLVALDDSSAEPRYRMLETIRQYGHEKLVAASEADAVRSRHLGHFADFAESLRVSLVVDDMNPRWNALADAELDNIRVALGWALGSALDTGHAERGLQLINALHRYWYQKMHWKEIVGWVERLGARSDEDGPPTLERARAIYVAAMLATNFDPQIGRRLCEECLALSRGLAFDEGMAWALMWIGYIDTRKRDPGTAELFRESLRVGRRIADPWRQSTMLTQCLTCYAGFEALMGRDESAEALVHELDLENEKLSTSSLYLGHSRALLGTMATRRGQFDRASALLTESLGHYRAIDSKFDIAGSLAQQGFLELRRGQPVRALQLFRESLPLHRNYPLSPWVTKGLAHLVIALAACQNWPTAARLAGVLAGKGSSDAATAPPELSGRVARAYQEATSQVCAALGEPAFRLAFDAGQQLTREAAITLALAD